MFAEIHNLTKIFIVECGTSHELSRTGNDKSIELDILTASETKQGNGNHFVQAPYFYPARDGGNARQEENDRKKMTYGIQSLAETNVALLDNRERSGLAGDNTIFGVLSPRRGKTWMSLSPVTGKRPDRLRECSREARRGPIMTKS